MRLNRLQQKKLNRREDEIEKEMFVGEERVCFFVFPQDKQSAAA